jgi:SAM-dependent methyltransferase
MTFRDWAAGKYASGLRWRLTSSYSRRARRERYLLFERFARPEQDTRVLDVGVTNGVWRSANFLEAAYPWPAQITAVAIGDVPLFREHFPEVRLVIADGRDLPFADGAFDVGFSNAVVEHVGSRSQQRQFVAELLRTCHSVMISTPNAAFPVDPHTMLPGVHWLPRRLRHPILRVTRNEVWASEAALNPLSARQLVSLFPPGVPVRLHRQRLLGLTTVLTAFASRHDPT